MILIMPAEAIRVDAANIDDLQKAINTSTLDIHKLEDSIQREKAAYTVLQAQEVAEKDQLKNRESDIIALINYLNHSKDFSPFLSLLATKDVNDIIHLSILLKYVSSALPGKFEGSFAILKSLAAVRHDLSQTEITISTLETRKRQKFSILKKQFSDLEELLDLQEQSLPVRHFESASQIQEVVKRLTLSFPHCQKVKKLTDLKIENPVFSAPETKDETFLYKGIKDSIVRAPFNADIILSGYSAETEGVILIRASEYIMLVEGIDKIVSFKGTRVKKQQPIGLVFSSSDNLNNAYKVLKVTLWQCKQQM